MASDALTFASFEKFKSEVALRTKRALIGQQQMTGSTAGLASGAARSRPISPVGFSSSRTASLGGAGSSGRSKSTERPRSARDRDGESERVPLHERVPERFKHTPRTLSQKSFEAEAAKTPGKTAAVSQRLLRLASTEKQRTVSLWPNSGNYSVGGVRCLVPETMEQLLDIAAQKVNLAAAARLVFRLPAGQAVTHIAQIEDEDCLVFSCKEPFRPASRPEKKERVKSAVIPVRETKSSKSRVAAVKGYLQASAGGDELKALLTDTSRLLRRFRLSIGGNQGTGDTEGRQRSLETVRLLCGLGAVSLRNQALTSLKGMPVVVDMAELYLQNNFLTELTWLPSQPKLKDLRLELNNISSFKGCVPHPRLEQVWLEGNPIAQHPHYRLMLLIVPNPNADLDMSVAEYQDYEYGGNLPQPRTVTIERESYLLHSSLSPSKHELANERERERERERARTSFGSERGERERERERERESGRGSGAHDSSDVGEEHARAAGEEIEIDYRASSLSSPHSSPRRKDAQIERLTEALVRASQKSSVKEKLLLETSARLRAVLDDNNSLKSEVADREGALKEVEGVLAKRAEQCRQLYEIVGTLEHRLQVACISEANATTNLGRPVKTSAASVQTDEWSVQNAAAVGEELLAERRSRAGERAALEAKIQRLEFSSAAAQNSSNHVHLEIFRDVRARLMSELSYSIPDSNVLLSLVKDIDSHLADFGGNE